MGVRMSGSQNLSQIFSEIIKHSNVPITKKSQMIFPSSLVASFGLINLVVGSSIDFFSARVLVCFRSGVRVVWNRLWIA